MLAEGDIHVMREIFGYIWREGRDCSSPEGFAALCERVGLPDAVQRIEDEGIKTRLRDNNERAVSIGVFGVPTFVVNEQIFWGEDTLPMVLYVARSPNWLDAAEVKRISMPMAPRDADFTGRDARGACENEYQHAGDAVHRACAMASKSGKRLTSGQVCDFLLAGDAHAYGPSACAWEAGEQARVRRRSRPPVFNRSTDMTDPANSLDIWLIRVLRTLLLERSVTQTAQRLNQTQPAINTALRRLRESLSDPILVHGKQEMMPTEYGESLLAPAQRALREAEFVATPHGDFDAASSRRTFRIAAPII